MPQPITYYDSGPISGSIKGGTLLYSVDGDGINYTSTTPSFWTVEVPPSGSGYVFVTDSYSQGVTGAEEAYPMFFQTAGSSSAQVLATVNAMRGVTSSFSDVQAAFQWMANSGKWLIIGQENTFDKINADGLVLYVDAGKLNSYPTTGSIWRDLSGNSAYVTLYNNPAFNSQGYIDFDGTDDYGIVTGASLSNTAYTKIAWFKPDVATANIISGGGDSQHAFWMASTNYLNAGHNGSWSTVQYTGQSLPGRWWMGAVTFNTTTGWVLYLNGNIVDTDPSTATFTGGNVIRIAAFNDAQNLFNGKISQAQVYNRVLSESEIKQNYYGGDIVTNGLVFALDAGNLVSYESGSTTTYSLTGSLSSSLINGVGYNQTKGGTWNFDGIDDYINSNYKPVLQSGDSYSQCVWFRTTSATVGDGGSNRLIEARDNTKTGAPLINSVVNWLTNDTLVFLVRGNNGIRRDLTVSGITVNDGTWRHLHCQILSNGHTQMYLNGKLIGSNTDGVDTNINLIDRPLAIGARNLEGTISSFFSGNIALAQIYNRSLTAAEVEQNFNAQRQRFGV
jgi:hypothetical protein